MTTAKTLPAPTITVITGYAGDDDYAVMPTEARSEESVLHEVLNAGFPFITQVQRDRFTDRLTDSDRIAWRVDVPSLQDTLEDVKIGRAVMPEPLQAIEALARLDALNERVIPDGYTILRVQMTREDVERLQVHLMCRGYTVAPQQLEAMM